MRFFRVAEALANAVLTMSKLSSDELAEMGRLARECYLANFDRDYLLQRLESWMIESVS